MLGYTKHKENKMSEKKSKVNKVYKFVYDLFTYELVIGGTALATVVAVGVVGFTPLTLLAAVVSPVVAGTVAYTCKL